MTDANGNMVMPVAPYGGGSGFGGFGGDNAWWIIILLIFMGGWGNNGWNGNGNCGRGLNGRYVSRDGGSYADGYSQGYSEGMRQASGWYRPEAMPPYDFKVRY